MSSQSFRTFRRRSIAHVPFLAAHHRVSDSALHTKLPNAHKYPALVLAVAAAAVAVAPLTANAATTTTTAKPATAAVAAAKSTAASKDAAKSTAKSAATNATAKTQSSSDTKKAETASSTKSTSSSTSTTPAVRSSNPYAGVSWGSLEPTGTEGSQETFSADSSQWSNARAIVQAASDMGLSPYAATIAVATALQESTLRNLTTAVDHDSVGLFQQRPSMGWGTASQLTDPTYAAKAFLSQLPSGYQNMSLSDAAQSVQRSFDGSLYAQWESQAAHMVHTIANG